MYVFEIAISQDNTLLIADPYIPNELYKNFTLFNSNCLTEWDPVGKYYNGPINYAASNETCDYWADYYPDVPHNLITEGNKCRGYSSPYMAKCYVKGTIQNCHIPKCTCNSPYFCIGPTNITFQNDVLSQAQRNCELNGAFGVLKIRSFVHNDFIRKYLSAIPGIFWLGFVIQYPEKVLNKTFHFEYMESVWGSYYFYRNLDVINPFEFITPNDITVDMICIVLDNRIPSDTLYWKLDYCSKKHKYICDFSSETSDSLHTDDKDNVFIDCAPPILAKWNNMYSGRHNRTRTGFPCQKWSEDYPNYIGDSIRNDLLKPLEEINHNYCRSLRRGFPVCMRDYPGGIMEICDVPSCVNVAPFGKAYQSSTDGKHEATLAINGIIGRTNETCSMTNSDIRQWWEIELPSTFFIVALSIVSIHSPDTHYSRLAISVRNKGVASIFGRECVIKIWTSNNEPRHFACRKWGQILRIGFYDPISMPLFICDVEIYAIASTDECYGSKKFKFDYQGKRMVPSDRTKTCRPWRDVINKYWKSNTVVYFPEGLLSKRDYELSASHIYFKYLITLEEVLQNYCRYVRVGGIDYEYPVCVGDKEDLIRCDELLSCQENSADNTCMFDEIGEEYRGHIDTARSGKKCRLWTYDSKSDTNQHSYIVKYPFLQLEKNYCRNPDRNLTGPWCFVNDFDLVKEACNIPGCVNMAKADTDVEVHSLGSGKLSTLWDDVSAKFHSSNFVTLIPSPSSNAKIIFKFKFPIRLLYVVVRPSFREEIHSGIKRDNLGNFVRLQVHTSHSMEFLNTNSSKCGEVLSVISINTLYIKCDRLTSVVMIEAGDPSFDLAISEIQLLSHQTLDACIRKKSKGSLEVQRLCKDIITYDLFNFGNPIFNKCTLWTMVHPQVQHDYKRYCDIIPVKRTLDYTREIEYCGFDVCGRKLSFLCKISKYGEEYRGNYSVTKSGYPCDHWINHREEISSFPWLLYEENYCRNPQKDSKGPWCFVAHRKETMDYCQVPDCMNIAPHGTIKMEHVKKPDNLLCLMEPQGLHYSGTKNHSENGPCKNWIDVKRWDYTERPNHNYCRNPNDRDKPWCYIHSLQYEWAYCSIPLCKNFIQGDLFSGIKAVDGKRDQSFESCAVTQSFKATELSYLTWVWKAPEIVKIVGIRIYPAYTHLEDIRGLKILLHNSGFRNAVICRMQNKAGNTPFIDYPCESQADVLSISLQVGQNQFSEYSTLALCEVEIYISSESRDCFNFYKGIDFMGQRSIATNGKICSMWESRKDSSKYNFPEGRGSDPGVLNLVMNFCRNPTLGYKLINSKPFCYTDDVIQNCDVQKCTEDTFSVVMVQPNAARLNKSFLLTCTASNVGFKPITIVWMRGNNIPIENSANFGVTQLNRSTSELHIRFLGSSLTMIICQATIGSHFASSIYSYTAQPECTECWDEIKKSCSIICGYYNPPTSLPLSKNCVMTCVLETVNATVQCIEIQGALMWQPVDICTYKPLITENMVMKEERRVPKNQDPQPLKAKNLVMPYGLVFFIFLIFILMFAIFFFSVFSESLRLFLM